MSSWRFFYKNLIGSGVSGGVFSFDVHIARYHEITVWQPFLEFFLYVRIFVILSQLLAMDASARVTMKDAAKCDKRREWQNSANQ